MKSGITVQFTLTRERCERAVRQALPKMGRLPIWITYVGLWALLTIMARYALSVMFSSLGSMGIQLAVAGGICAVGVFLLARFAQSRSLDQLGDLDLCYHFSEAGVEKRTNNTDSRIDWEAFYDRMETKDFYFLKYPKQGAAQIMEIIPKASFATSEDEQQFGLLVAERVPPALDAPSPIFGRIWPLFLIAFLAVFLMLYFYGRALSHPSPLDVTMDEYLEYKTNGKVDEIWISKAGVLEAIFPKGIQRGGKLFYRVRLELAPSILEHPSAYEPLLSGIPRDRVHDEYHAGR